MKLLRLKKNTTNMLIEQTPLSSSLFVWHLYCAQFVRHWEKGIIDNHGRRMLAWKHSLEGREKIITQCLGAATEWQIAVIKITQPVFHNTKKILNSSNWNCNFFVKIYWKYFLGCEVSNQTPDNLCTNIFLKANSLTLHEINLSTRIHGFCHHKQHRKLIL